MFVCMYTHECTYACIHVYNYTSKVTARRVGRPSPHKQTNKQHQTKTSCEEGQEFISNHMLLLLNRDQRPPSETLEAEFQRRREAECQEERPTGVRGQGESWRRGTGVEGQRLEASNLAVGSWVAQEVSGPGGKGGGGGRGSGRRSCEYNLPRSAPAGVASVDLWGDSFGAVFFFVLCFWGFSEFWS